MELAKTNPDHWDLSNLVDLAHQGYGFELVRGGKPVVVMLPYEEYRRLVAADLSVVP